jgi:agmatine deiminase
MTRTLTTTPAADGFRMPGEYEAHAGCWMLWPERADNWRLAAAPAQSAFAQVAAAIARFEPVTVGASGKYYESARRALPEAVRVVEMSHDDSWMRDVGPSFVVHRRGTVRGVHWHFNAWGGLEPQCQPKSWFPSTSVPHRTLRLKWRQNSPRNFMPNSFS